MSIYYQESRISSITFAKTEHDLYTLINNDNNNGFKINPKFDLKPKVNELENQKLETYNQIQEIKNSSNQINLDNINNKNNNDNLSEEQLQQIELLSTKLRDITSELIKFKKELYSQADIELDKIIKSISTLPANTKAIIIDAESPIFHDIEFSIDSNKVEINSKSIHQDPLSGISLGNSVMLDSLMDQHFVILPGRQSSNIKSNLNQNHECIDAIAANGLMSSPKIMTEYSIGKIINEISKNKKLKDLNIYIIHSALKAKILSYPGISKDNNIPCYAVGKGEILSVFYRYLAITFFPYMAVYDSVKNIDYKYDI